MLTNMAQRYFLKYPSVHLIGYMKRYFLAGDEGKIDPWHILALGAALEAAAWRLRLPSAGSFRWNLLDILR
jgi:hypothetical protein